jgi:glycosyltransferase involved in cell wall biosynthesis
MISSLHGLYDDRIYWKEALSLVRNGYEVIHTGLGDKDIDLYSDHGIRLIQIKRKGYFKNPYLDIAYRKVSLKPDAYRKLFEKCASLKADIYHFHDVQLNRIGPSLKRLDHHPAVIYDVHEDYREQVMYSAPRGPLRILFRMHARMLRKLEMRTAGIYDAIITVVPHIAEYFRKAAGPAKVHVIYNYTIMSPVKYIPSEEKIYDAVYSGMINDVRGGTEIVRAAAILKKEFPGIRILLVGPIPDASYLKKIKNLIDELDLGDNVVLKGQVPYSDIENLLLQSCIGLGIFKPVSIFEFGIQVKTFEYMICGLPVVCSNTGNIAGIIKDNNAGLTVDPRSPESIAAAIAILMKTPVLYNTLRINAITAARDKFCWNSEEKKLLELYHSL